MSSASSLPVYNEKEESKTGLLSAVDEKERSNNGSTITEPKKFWPGKLNFYTFLIIYTCFSTYFSSKKKTSERKRLLIFTQFFFF